MFALKNGKLREQPVRPVRSQSTLKKFIRDFYTRHQVLCNEQSLPKACRSKSQPGSFFAAAECLQRPSLKNQYFAVFDSDWQVFCCCCCWVGNKKFPSISNQLLTNRQRFSDTIILCLDLWQRSSHVYNYLPIKQRLSSDSCRKNWDAALSGRATVENSNRPVDHF